MAKDLKKFVNPKFLKTVDLRLLRRLFERQRGTADHFNIAIFDADEPVVRRTLTDLFAGAEDLLPRGLVADLHRIAELGNENGMVLIQSWAERRNIQIAIPTDENGDQPPLDPKHFALLTFLNHQGIFDAASDLMALESRASLAEYAGADEDVEPQLDDATKASFEDAARELFRRDYRGAYCRVGWYDDDGEVNIVVTHGAPVTIKPVIEGDEERVISYRSAEHAVLSYEAATGRLKIGGLTKARQSEMVTIFARTMLGDADFFGADDSQHLYTLAPVERGGPDFVLDHAFDPGIHRVQFVEVQIDRINTNADTNEVFVDHSIVAKDGRRNALGRLSELPVRRLGFGPNTYRIGHIIFRVHFSLADGRRAKVTIKIKPPSLAQFKRHRFEGRIMEMLRRNGFCIDREPADTAAAAE